MERMLFVIISLLILLALLTFLPFLKRRRAPGPPQVAARSVRIEKKQDVRVWVNTRSGFYYCRQTGAYGRLGPGKFMLQGDALESGYRPYFRQMCPTE